MVNNRRHEIMGDRRSYEIFSPKSERIYNYIVNHDPTMKVINDINEKYGPQYQLKEYELSYETNEMSFEFIFHFSISDPIVYRMRDELHDFFSFIVTSIGYERIKTEFVERNAFVQRYDKYCDVYTDEVINSNLNNRIRCPFGVSVEEYLQHRIEVYKKHLLLQPPKYSSFTITINYVDDILDNEQWVFNFDDNVLFYQLLGTEINAMVLNRNDPSIDTKTAFTKELEKSVKYVSVDSQIERHERKQEKLLEVIDKLSGPEFEVFCAEILEKNGFTNVSLTPGSGDQGLDILASKSGIKYGFQCKCYSFPVGNSAVQEAFAGKQYYGCHVAVVLSNSTFTPSAVSLANKVGVILWDRKQLHDLVIRTS